MDLLTLLILIMTTWRISSLLVNEDGPFEMFVATRRFVGRFSEVLSCLWCCSVWVGLAITALYSWWPMITFWAMVPFALSAGAIAWDKWNG